MPARVLDESAGGFAVQVDQPVGYRVGATLLFQFADAWMEVRVVNVQPLEKRNRPDGKAPTRINLARLRDVPAPVGEDAALSWDRLRSMMVPMMSSGTPMLTNLILVAGISVVSLGLVMALEKAPPLKGNLRVVARPQKPESKGVDDRLRAAANTSPPAEAPAAPQWAPRPAVMRQPAGQTNAPQKPAPATSDRVPVQAVSQEIESLATRLAHPDFLLRSEVAKSLSLSDEQRRHLQALATQVDRASEAGDRASDEAIGSLRRRGMAILTAAQQEALARLQRQASADGDGDIPDETTDQTLPAEKSDEQGRTASPT